jgi:hypothetical protein
MKESAEEFFINKISEFTISIKKERYCDNIIIIKDSEGYVVMYNRKNSYLYVDYEHVWSIFEKEYRMNYKDIQTFIIDMFLKHLNCRPEKPTWSV